MDEFRRRWCASRRKRPAARSKTGGEAAGTKAAPGRSIAFGGGTADGNAGMKNLLGGKGANLAEMAGLGLPVPPGFTISTEVCTYYYAHKRQLPGGAARRRRAPAAPGRTAASASASAIRPTRCWSRCAPAPAPRCRA